MSVRINGKQTTRAYEQIGENLAALGAFIDYSSAHLNHVSQNTYEQFQLLKLDYNSSGLDFGTYLEFLKSLKSFYEQYPD